MQTNTSQISSVMKALGDENRLKILSMLETSSLCACEILTNLQISQSTLSHHMAILSEAGLVSAWSVGKWTHYQLCTEGIDLAQSFLANLHATAATQPIEDSLQPNSVPACACATEKRIKARPDIEMSIA